MRCKKSSLAFHHRWCGYGWWTDGPTVTCYRCWPRVVLFPDPAGTQAPRYPRIGTAKAGERDIATFSTSHIPATSGIAVDFAFRHSFVPPLIDVSIRSFRVSSKLYLHPSSNYFTVYKQCYGVTESRTKFGTFFFVHFFRISPRKTLVFKLIRAIHLGAIIKKNLVQFHPFRNRSEIESSMRDTLDHYLKSGKDFRNAMLRRDYFLRISLL